MTFALDKFLRFLPAAAFAMVAEFLTGISGSIVCGHVIGEDGLSSIGLIQPVTNAVAFLALLVGTGTSVLYSVEMGRFDKRRASEFLTQGLWSALMLGFAAAAILLMVRVRAAESFGVTGPVLAGLKEYWLWFTPCAVLEPLFFYLSSICYADGDGRICVWAYVVQIFSNFVLAFLLTTAAGFAGCALAMVLGHILSLGVLSLHFRRKTNSLRFVRHFSLKDTLSICKCSIGDASSKLFDALLILALNVFVITRFGEGVLPVLAAVVAVLGLIEVFDAIPRAMQPIASVYIGEGNDRLTRRILRYGEVAAGAFGTFLTLVLCAFPSLILMTVGINDPALVGPAKTAVRLVSLGLVGMATVSLFNSYFTFISRENLAFVLTLLALFVMPIVLFPVLGVAFGVNGVWSALAIAPYAAIAAIAAFITVRYGAKALPHFLHREKLRRSRVFDLALEPSEICKLSERIYKFLVVRHCSAEKKANFTSLLIEETLMLVKEHNKGRRISAEVTLDFSKNIRLIMRDDGEIFDITDADARISSLRSYMVSNLMIAIPARRNMMTTGYNRNAFEI